MKRYCPLASGSKGNCTYIETDEVRLLVDAGLSTKGISERLAQIGVSLAEIQGILITHEHIDHIRALTVLASRYNIPVYANAETAKAIFTSLGFCPKFKIFTTGEKFTIGDLNIHPFSIPHDASEPVAYTFEWGATKLGICTDLGYATTLVRSVLKGCTHLIVEANHHPPMVHASARPMVLKQRILGRTGHLSNEECGQLLAEIYSSALQRVHLAHLSEECNTPQKALDIVGEVSNHCVALSVAPQHEIAAPVEV